MMAFVFLLKFAVKCLGVLAWPVFGLGYPLCASIQAIETNSNSDTQKLISYWVSISVVLLLEHSFQLEWLAFWPYIKLMIVGCLVLPYFDGSLYVYKHLINPCLSMSPATITCQFNKQEELCFKKDDFLVEMKRYKKENGSDALEDLIASTKKSAKPNVDVKEIRAVEAEDMPKFEQLLVRFKDSNDVEITEKIEVASTKQPELPIRFKDGDAVEVTEKQEVASTTQAREAESNINHTENRTFPPLESINTATTTVGGGDLCGILPPEKVQKLWTCVICQVTAKNETALIAHLHGNRHKATCEQLNVKNQTDVNSHLQGKRHKKTCEPLNFKKQASYSNVSPASVGRNLMNSRCIEMIGSHWWCKICNVSSVHGKQSHLKGKRHRASLQALDGLGDNRHA
ncbi:PREDICTED: uncharacterized protein LOC105135233 isoform X2 [Populus euphratica]|uniref:HVA22-like protein n=1 Tax=Populus euphratica TaxID=75702 RepID=A0AAJ6Y0S5_POPEU|nr:PREDICTED: uncharacterized protein LOC105135233 isoform X2 [Populus euphratica]